MKRNRTIVEISVQLFRGGQTMGKKGQAAAAVAHRVTSVGERELADLQARWDEYQGLCGDFKTDKVVDPVLALRSTGAVLRAVRNVLATSTGAGT